MKTVQEINAIATEWFESNYNNNEHDKYALLGAYCEGYNKGYEDGCEDGKGASTIPSLIKRCRALVKRADAVHLHFIFDLSFRYETADVRIYETDNDGMLGDQVFSTRLKYTDILNADKRLDEAEDFITKYTRDSAVYLTKKMATLTQELTETKKALRKVKRSIKTNDHLTGNAAEQGKE